jgi:CelD/BcsL family acetyltransferase involved in cellulose biosynthesis
MKTEVSNKSGISIRHICDIVEFEKLNADWKSLYDECNYHEAFLTWEWMFAWWKHHQQGKKLWLITAWLDDTLCGIAPLMLVEKPKYGLKFRSLVNLSYPDNDISGFIIRDNNPEILDAICSYIVSHRRAWDVIEMAELPADGLEARGLKSFFQKLRYDIKEDLSPHFYLTISGDWETFFNSLDPSEKADLKKNTDRAKKAGKVSFRKFIGKDLMWDHFLEVFRINEQSRFPNLYPETERKFLEELFNLTREMDFMEIAFVQLNDDFVASNFGFTINKRHEGWRTAYDRNYSKIGPGRNMFALLFENFFAQGYREVDFLRGAEVYKSNWKPSFREYADIRIVSKTKIITNIYYVQLSKLRALVVGWMDAIKQKRAQANDS